MRKHFLILMLTALLPLVAWAQADPATKTAPAAKANLVYNGAEQELVTAAVLKDDATEGTEIYYDVVAKDDPAPAWPSNFAKALPKKLNAGSYDVYYLTRLSSTNSNIVKAATVTIAKADLLVKAKDVTHYYTGTALTTLTGLEIIYDGWKGNDEANKAAILSGQEPTLTTIQTAVGSYTITPNVAGKEIANYNFVPVSGTMTIVKRKVQIGAKDMGPFDFGSAGSKNKSWAVQVSDASIASYLTVKLQDNAVGAAVETFNTDLDFDDDDDPDVKANTADWFQKVGGSAADKNNIKGFTLTRNGDNNVGEYVITPAGALITAGKSASYEFVYKTGTFTIQAIPVTVTPLNATKVYGDADPEKYPFNVSVETLTNEEKALIVATRTEGETVGTYDITVSGPATISGYNVTYDNAVKGKFMITQRPVTVTALPQLLYTGNTVNDLNVAEVYVEGVLEGDPDIEVVLSFDEGVITADHNVGLDASTPKKLTLDIDQKTVANAIVPALKAGKEYPNYKFNFVPGTLAVVNLATVMLLTDADASLTDKLTAANNANRNISFGTRSLKAETWNVLVLPFATTVKEISEAFGYAVVDILDETASDGNVHLKLHMGAIPANTPFIVKNYADKDLNTVLFIGKKIEYTAAGENVFVEDAAGNKFFGTYNTTEVYGSNIQYMTGSGIFKDAGAYTADKKLTLKPLRAYLQTVAQNNAGAAPMIYIEEPDGSTTAIETVSAVKAANGNDAIFNLAGQKVGADYKGIVIKNGKRFVQK